MRYLTPSFLHFIKGGIFMIFNHPHNECKHPKMHYLIEILSLFLIGGAVYVGIELLWRGYSHWSMFIVGGLAFLAIGGINNYFFDYKIGMIPQMIIGGISVDIIEFIAGVILNIWLKLDIWDYSDLAFNILGQVSLPFTFAWMGLSFISIVVDDQIRYILFGEPKVHYHWFWCDCKDKNI